MRVQLIPAVEVRNGNHEVTPRVTDQAFDFALVVALECPIMCFDGDSLPRLVLLLVLRLFKRELTGCSTRGWLRVGILSPSLRQSLLNC